MNPPLPRYEISIRLRRTEMGNGLVQVNGKGQILDQSPFLSKKPLKRQHEHKGHQENGRVGKSLA